MHRLLVAFGNADHGRLGLGATTLSSVMTPRVNLALARYDLENLAAGGAHTVVVTRKSQAVESFACCVARLGLRGVVAWGLTVWHFCLAAGGGLVFTFGLNTRGQLGHSAEADSAAVC